MNTNNATEARMEQERTVSIKPQEAPISVEQVVATAVDSDTEPQRRNKRRRSRNSEGPETEPKGEMKSIGEETEKEEKVAQEAAPSSLSLSQSATVLDSQSTCGSLDDDEIALSSNGSILHEKPRLSVDQRRRELDEIIMAICESGKSMKEEQGEQGEQGEKVGKEEEEEEEDEEPSKRLKREHHSCIFVPDTFNTDTVRHGDISRFLWMGTQAVMKYFFKMSWHSQGECIETVLSRSSLTPCRQLVEEWHSDVQKNPKHPLYQIMQQRKKISSQEEGERGETPSLQQHFHKDLWTRESLIAFLSSDFIQGDFRFLWTWKDIRVEWVIDVLDCPGEACPWKEEYLQISTRVVQQLRAISVSTPFLAQIPLALKMCVLQLWKRRFRLFEPLPLCLPREWVLDRSFCQAFLNGRMEFQRKNKTKGDVVSPDPSAPLSSQSLLSQQRQEQEQSQKRKPARSENQNGNENQEEEEVEEVEEEEEEVEEEEEEKASPLVSIFEASEHRKICLGRGVSPAWFAQIEENGHERSTYDPYFRFTDNPTICFYSPAERACMGYNDPVVQATAHKFAEMWDQYFIEIEYDQDWTHILHPQEEGERERKSDKKKELEREDSQDDVPRSLSLFETQKDDGGRKKEEQIDRHLADLFTYSVHAPFVSALEYERIDVQVGRRGKEFPLSFQAPSHLLFLFPRIWGKEAIAQTSMFLRDVTPRLDVVSALSHTEEDLTQNHLPMVFLSSVWLGSIRKAVSDYMHLEPSSKKIWEETARSVFDQEGRLRSPLPPEKEYILVGPHNGLVLARTRQLRHCFHCWVWLEYTWAKINRAHHPFDPLVFNYPELCMEKWKFDFDAMGRAQKQQVIRRFEKVVEEEIRRLVVDVVSTVKKEEQWNDFPLVDHTDPPSQ